VTLLTHTLRSHYRSVGAREVAPRAQAHDTAGTFDREAFQRVAASGLFRVHIRKELGGEGLGLREFAAALEGFAEGCGDLGFSIAVVAHAGCLLTTLQEFGTAEQHARWMPGLLSGELLGAVANAEPRGGTDVMNLRARAVPTRAGFVLTARKQNITNVGEADLVLTSARLQGVLAREAVNIFLVEGKGERVRQRAHRDLMGLRTSPTGDLLAWRAPLGPEARLGALGEGVAFFRRVFSLERLFIGYLYLGAIRRCLVRAVQHAETRQSFGAALGTHQYVQEKVVRMRIAEELLSAQLERTLEALLAGHDVFGALSIIKAWGCEAARQSAEDLISLLGSQGLRTGERAQKDFRDLMGLSILGGTVELQKIVIYRETVKALAKRLPSAPRDSLSIEVKSADELDPALEAELVALAARTFPNEPKLEGRYFYDTRPDSVVIARHDGRVVGLRIITRRTVPFGKRALKLAGIGIAVDPAFQRRGIGRELTRVTLELLRSLGDELAVAFLFSPNARTLLTGFGFVPLEAVVSYTARSSNARVVEQAPCYVMELGEPESVLPELRERGKLHLGLGTW
jgi:alkylation response protein AidB-like acyl-CoA dehydrogenase/GNAT superfamily N-acetyltransferase